MSHRSPASIDATWACLRTVMPAPPVDGAANEALCKWLAKTLGLPSRQVSLIRGDTSRRKQVALACPAEQVITWLAQQATLQNTDPDVDKG
jgi:uncharacterized protein YggU (UPF0235/DUF167 family)